MSSYILLRHGQSLFNAGLTEEYDSDLTERGSIQAQEGALHVKEVMELEWPDFFHDYVGFVSSYLRALRTAEPLAQRWKIKFTVDYRIGEVPTEHYRKFYSTLKPRMPDFPLYDWGLYPMEGVDIQKRTMDDYWTDLETFIVALPEKAIIVSHMTTIQDLAALLTNKERHSLHALVVPNASVTLIEDGVLVFMGQR